MTAARFLVAGEDRGHFEAVSTLVDRVLVEERGLDPDDLGAHRIWAEDEGRTHLALKNAYARARARGLPIYGHFGGQPALEDAPQWRAVFLLAQDRKELPAVVFAARDVDGHAQRRDGLHQAIGERPWKFAVVPAVADPEVEAWSVVGFEPRDERERAILERTRRELGLDPRSEAHRLTGGTPRDAKQLLHELTDRDAERTHACLRDTPLATLEARGNHIGLKQFLDDTRRHLGPATAPLLALLAALGFATSACGARSALGGASDAAVPVDSARTEAAVCTCSVCRGSCVGVPGCPNGLCRAGRCLPRCAADFTCPAGMTCGTSLDCDTPVSVCR